MRGQLRIDTVTGWVVVDEDGTEGIIGMNAGGGLIPLIGADADRIESFRPYAQEVANRLGKRIELVRWRVREHREWLESDGTPPDPFVKTEDEVRAEAEARRAEPKTTVRQDHQAFGQPIIAEGVEAEGVVVLSAIVDGEPALGISYILDGEPLPPITLPRAQSEDLLRLGQQAFDAAKEHLQK